MESYESQVNLLLKTLPYIAKEKCFALHGGTAINLFVWEMPRLSVDIDLTYIHIKDRKTSFEEINEALSRICDELSLLPGIKLEHKDKQLKLNINDKSAAIKVEVNQGMRGVISGPEATGLCKTAQERFDQFTEINLVPKEQLFGGKIVAALDRQHPRDLFDVSKFFKDHSISDVKAGLIYCLLSTNRPISEILAPNLLDQSETFRNQFYGMASEEFGYQNYEETRSRLIYEVNNSLSDSDKSFLISFKRCSPNWETYDYSAFPSIKWKLKNLEDLKDTNPTKHAELVNRLEEVLKL